MKAKKALFTFLASMIIMVLNAQTIPQKISYQGRLLEDGALVSGYKEITFKIGSWTETQSVNLKDGLYSVQLGSINPIPFDVFEDDSNLQLQISIDGVDMNPQVEILSVPFAIMSENTKKISGNAVSEDEPSVNQVLKWNGVSWIPSLDEVGSIYSGGTGIALTNNIISAESTVPMWNANSLYGFSLSSATPEEGEVLKWNSNKWESLKDNDNQVLSLNGTILSITGGNSLALPLPNLKWLNNGDNIFYNSGYVGVGPNMDSPQFPFHVVSTISSPRLGVAHFVNQARDVDAAGISAICANTDYFGYGGVFVGGYCGVSGRVITNSNNSSNIYIGVSGYAESAENATLYGVFGKVNGGSSNSYAGYFLGDVHVTGNLSKGSGSFKIDHPLDPQNKYLAHSFVESPDMMNVYNGNVILDEKGEAIIVLPDYFESLNMEYRYQLTCIGGFSQVYISEEIIDNKFKISGGIYGLKVSWQVTGIRKDPYANMNRVAVETEKPINEKGYYLHYKEYDQSYEKSIESIHDSRTKIKEGQ